MTIEDQAYENLYDNWEIVNDSLRSDADRMNAYFMCVFWKAKVKKIIETKRLHYAKRS